MADDFGWGSPGYNQPAGQPRAKTPNLDAMSTGASTMRFDKFYSGGPVCSPVSVLHPLCMGTNAACRSRRLTMDLQFLCVPQQCADPCEHLYWQDSQPRLRLDRLCGVPKREQQGHNFAGGIASWLSRYAGW